MGVIRGTTFIGKIDCPLMIVYIAELRQISLDCSRAGSAIPFR
jgi:hypothetical protein